MKFGAANSAAHQETTQNVENKQAVDDGGMKALEGYFDNLAAAAMNEKSVLQKPVLNNTTRTTSNESLVALVKKMNRRHEEPRMRNLAPQEGRTGQHQEHNPLK